MYINLKGGENVASGNIFFATLILCFILILCINNEVIVPRVVVYFIQSVTIQKMHTNKYKNTVHKQKADQYIQSREMLQQN